MHLASDQPIPDLKSRIELTGKGMTRRGLSPIKTELIVQPPNLDACGRFPITSSAWFDCPFIPGDISHFRPIHPSLVLSASLSDEATIHYGSHPLDDRSTRREPLPQKRVPPTPSLLCLPLLPSGECLSSCVCHWREHFTRNRLVSVIGRVLRFGLRKDLTRGIHGLRSSSTAWERCRNAFEVSALLELRATFGRRGRAVRIHRFVEVFEGFGCRELTRRTRRILVGLSFKCT